MKSKHTFLLSRSPIWSPQLNDFVIYDIYLYRLQQIICVFFCQVLLAEKIDQEIGREKGEKWNTKKLFAAV